MKKIVMLTSSYPRSESDNSSPFLMHLINYLRKYHNNEVHIVAPDSQYSIDFFDDHVHYFRYFYKPWQQLAYGSGILPNLRRNPLLWALVPFFLIAMFIKLCAVMIKHKPDIIHAHWILPQGFLAILSKFIFKKPVVVTAHGADAYAYQSGLLMKLKKFTLSHCDSWTANTIATAIAAWPNHQSNKPVIIPMGVDVSHFSSGSRKHLRKKNEHRKIVLFVGRLVEKKGINDLLEAFSALPDDIKQSARLWIVGDGHKRTELEQLSEKLEISGLVRFWGQVPNLELPHYYAAADLFVGSSVADLSGDTEGQGVVFIEAFASKLCVIATRIGGIPEVVEDGITGVLVEPESPDKLALAIASLLSDDQKRQLLAANAFKTAYEKYDWVRVSGQFNRLYDDILSIDRSSSNHASE